MSFYSNSTTISADHICSEDELNRKGSMHGGNITKLLDDISGKCGLEYNQTFVSTLAIHYVLMTKPLFPGNRLRAYATIVRTGKTSMFVRSWLFLVTEGKEELVAKAGMTIVAVQNHFPTEVKPLNLQSEAALLEAKKAEEILALFKSMSF